MGMDQVVFFGVDPPSVFAELTGWEPVQVGLFVPNVRVAGKRLRQAATGASQDGDLMPAFGKLFG